MDGETDTFSGYFNSHVEYMKIIGVWIPPKSADSQEKFKRKFLFACLCSYFVWYLSSEALFLVTADSLDDIVGISRDILSHLVLIYKVFNYVYLKEDIYEVMNELIDSSFYYEEFGSFKPKMIVNKYIFEVIAWRKLLMYSVLVLSSTLFFSQVGLMVFYGDTQYITVDGEKIYNQRLPVAMWSPFGQGEKWKYFYTLCICSIGITMSGNLIVGTDMLFASLVSCISAHLKVLNGAFASIRQRCVLRLNLNETELENVIYDPEILQKSMEHEMKYCVKHLQFLYRIAARVEEFFAFQALFQTMLSLFVICFCVYNVEAYKGTGSGNVAFQIIYFTALSSELLTYCWFGEQIIKESDELSYAIYGSEWLSASLKLKKLVIFTLARLNKPIFITVGKFSPLKFSIFLTVMRGAYSFNAVLRQVQNK